MNNSADDFIAPDVFSLPRTLEFAFADPGHQTVSVSQGLFHVLGPKRSVALVGTFVRVFSTCIYAFIDHVFHFVPSGVILRSGTVVTEVEEFLDVPVFCLI